MFLVVAAAVPMPGDPPASQPSLPVQTVIVSATAESATATVHLPGIDRPQLPDLQVTVPSSDDRSAPKVTITGVTGAAKDWDVGLTAEALNSFGESIATLLYKGQPKSIVRFLKPGLVVKRPDGGFTAKEESFRSLRSLGAWFPWHADGTPLTIVLENPASVAYPKVRARLRFQDTDVCEAATDSAQSGNPGDNSKCDDPAHWASFAAARFTTTTLRASGAKSWFRDAQSGYPKSAKRAGTLTLRYDPAPGSNAPVYEQNIPLEVQFDPSSSSLFFTLLKIGAGLLAGALLSLILRVTIPNYRRKRAIKEQFAQAKKATRGISDAVNSMLRVLLRVERLTLESNLRTAWIGGPGFGEVAQRVEQGLAATKRKIDFAKRLDAAVCRKSGLAEQDAPPTRLDNIDRNIAAITDALLREQLGEQDWVFIQQRLEALDKLLGEPSQEELDAFQALLVQRWKSISDFFKRHDDGSLKVPDALLPMKDCFPMRECLPNSDDPDGSRWVKDIGLTRADLQLSALALVRDFLFLLPPTGLTAEPYSLVKNDLTFLLQTPGIETLSAARRILRELEQRTPVWKIEVALRAHEAVIEVDPQIPSRNENTRLFLRFRDPELNGSIARTFLECEWELQDRPGTKPPGWWTSLQAKAGIRPQDPPVTKLHERGWEIYHYFENNITESQIKVRFYEYGKHLKTKPPTPPQAGQGQPEQGQPEQAQLEPPVLEYQRTVFPGAQDINRDRWWRFYRNEKFQRIMPEALQLGAALLVPLAALAVSQAGQAGGQWWDLIGIGFGSETIRNILTGTPEQSGAASQPSPPK